MRKGIKLLFVIIMVACGLFAGCNKEDDATEPETNNPTQSQLVFKCKIDGVAFVATSVITQGTSGIITAKGLVVSNGKTPTEGTIKMTLSFGTNSLSELGLGQHQILGSNFPTANSPDNKNKAIFKDVTINGLQAYVVSGSTVNVEKYYQSTYWQGAKGTFTNVKFDTFTAAPEFKQASVTLTDGEFDVKYVVPGL